MLELWRREPFRMFFPVAVILGWVGIGHWLFYSIGWSASFSCFLHGTIQLQAFLMAFAIGFLLTAIPRRTQTLPPSWLEIGALLALLSGVTVAALGERWVLAEIAYALLFALLLQFALRRFLGSARGRRPPAAFVLIPIGTVQAIAGAAMIAGGVAQIAPPWVLGLGRLLVEQGVFLCFVVGIGGLVLPLMSGAAPPADLGSSPRERRRAVVYGVVGVLIFASLLLENLGWMRGGPWLRAAVVSAGLLFGAPIGKGPGRPGLHRRLTWAAVWCIPLGLVVAGIWPDYRVASLHIVFIGGFGLMAFAVATHVAFSHVPELEPLAVGNPRAVIILGASLALSLVARIAADLSHSYFDHLGWAAGFWLAGSTVWLAFLGPKLLRGRE